MLEAETWVAIAFICFLGLLGLSGRAPQAHRRARSAPGAHQGRARRGAQAARRGAGPARRIRAQGAARPRAKPRPSSPAPRPKPSGLPSRPRQRWKNSSPAAPRWRKPRSPRPKPGARRRARRRRRRRGRRGREDPRPLPPKARSPTICSPRASRTSNRNSTESATLGHLGAVRGGTLPRLMAFAACAFRPSAARLALRRGLFLRGGHRRCDRADRSRYRRRNRRARVGDGIGKVRPSSTWVKLGLSVCGPHRHRDA